MAKGAAVGAKQAQCSGGSGGGGQGEQQQQQQGGGGGASVAAGRVGVIGRVVGYSKLKVVIVVVCVCSCLYGLSLLLLSPWACSQVFQSNDCSPVLGLMFSKSSSNSNSMPSLFSHQAATHLRHTRYHNGHANFLASGLNADLPASSLACAAVAQKNKTGTDISRIVFGIAAASETWIKGRREYVKLWWKPENKMRGYVWLEKEITEGTWGEEYPPFQVSEDTTNFEYTNSWGGRDALRISRIVSETFRLGLPDVDWFVMGDDDTVFFTENLVQVLSKYDHTKPFYVGYASESHRENIIFSFEMAFGGAGYAISYPLAKELANIQDSCIRRYPHFFGGDDRIYACMAELGVPLTKEPGFHQGIQGQDYWSISVTLKEEATHHWHFGGFFTRFSLSRLEDIQENLDIRRDAMGILAAHPVAPLVSLHHLDFIPEIYPKTRTKSFSQIEAVKYLLDAAAVDPGSILQQSICYDRNQDWSISVSWGYVVEVYKGFISPLELQRPARTFLSWYHENEAGTFSLNVREIAAEVCQRPTRFFLEDIQGPQAELDGLMEGVFLKLEDPEQSECDEKLMPLSVVKTVHVLKEPLDPSWYQSPQRSCCRIEDWRRDKIDIHVGACREGESLLSAD